MKGVIHSLRAVPSTAVGRDPYRGRLAREHADGRCPHQVRAGGVPGYGTAPAARKRGRGGTGTAVVGWPEGQPRVAMASLNVADGRMAAEALAASGW